MKGQHHELTTRAGVAYLATLAAGIGSVFTVVGNAADAPTSPQAAVLTEHYTIAASAFAPDSLGDTSQDYTNNWNPTSLSDPGDARCFNVGLALPPDNHEVGHRLLHLQGRSP